MYRLRRWEGSSFPDFSAFATRKTISWRSTFRSLHPHSQGFPVVSDVFFTFSFAFSSPLQMSKMQGLKLPDAKNNSRSKILKFGLRTDRFTPVRLGLRLFAFFRLRRGVWRGARRWFLPLAFDNTLDLCSKIASQPRTKLRNRIVGILEKWNGERK